MEQFFSNIAFVSDKFPTQEFQKRLMLKRLAFINVSRCNHEAEQLSFLVADKVELESEEPSHRALAFLGDTLESLMNMNTMILAYPKRSTVHEADTCTIAKQHLHNEKGKRNGHIFLQFHKTVVGNKFREQVTQVLRDMLQIEMSDEPIFILRYCAMQISRN